jgi:hypothetical protein
MSTDPGSRIRPEEMSKSAWKRLKRRLANGRLVVLVPDPKILETINESQESNLPKIPKEEKNGDTHIWAKLGFAALAAAGLGTIGLAAYKAWKESKKPKLTSDEDSEILRTLEGIN